MIKLKYFNQCDKWRINYTLGEENWHEMMRNKMPISQRAFENTVDVINLLDDDEKLDDFILADPEHCFYKSEISGIPVLFLQMAGFEFIFTENGDDPAFLLATKHEAKVDEPGYK